MNIKSLQNSLKAVYYSLGGNADNVRDTDDIDSILNAISALGIGAEIESAGGLPEIAAGDTGKYLKAGSSGPEWATVSGGSGVLIVKDEEGTLDTTWQEIKDAGFAILNVEGTVGYLYNISSGGGYYEVAFFTVTGTAFDSPLVYVADSASGYPVWSE